MRMLLLRRGIWELIISPPSKPRPISIERWRQYSAAPATRARQKERRQEWVEEEVVEDVVEEQPKSYPEPKSYPSRRRPTEDEERDDEERAKGKKKRRPWPMTALLWSPLPLAAIYTTTKLRKLRDPEYPLRHWEIRAYRLFPWRTLSRTWGFVNSIPLPTWARTPVLTWYASTFGCELSEAEVQDLTAYSNLGEFFRRSLKPGSRPICPTASLVSPADGTVLHSGPLSSSSGMVEQVKGVAYSLLAFLGPNTFTLGPPSTWLGPPTDDPTEYVTSLLKNPEANCLYTIVIYLAPGDYHRFHSPVEWVVTSRRHFSGELLSVNPRMAKRISGLFALNERAVYVGEWEHGFFSMTAVGATNVGSIRVYDDPKLSTNSWLRSGRPGTAWEDQNLRLRMEKGQPFGEFNLGSTIVLLFEAPKNLEALGDSNKVQVGRSLLPSAQKYLSQ